MARRLFGPAWPRRWVRVCSRTLIHSMSRVFCFPCVCAPPRASILHVCPTSTTACACGCQPACMCPRHACLPFLIDRLCHPASRDELGRSNFEKGWAAQSGAFVYVFLNNINDCASMAARAGRDRCLPGAASCTYGLGPFVIPESHSHGAPQDAGRYARLAWID